MKQLNSKDVLLQTQMNKLGLGRIFDSYFYNNYTRIPQHTVLTLGQFMQINNDILAAVMMGNVLKTRNMPQSAPIDVSLLSKHRTCKTWKILRTFLLENGFTYKDWVHLLPETQTPEEPIDKEVILSLNILVLIDLRARYSAHICDYIYRKDNRSSISKYQLTVSDILALTENDITIIIYSGSSHFSMIRTALKNMHQKFRDYGLTGNDGPFMQSTLFSKQKHSGIKEAVIKKLIPHENHSAKHAG